MGVIHLLDPKTISQIAAGEVIERPASVVKELVENSIDAGARRIRVELAEGGRTMVRVTDDGRGMSPEDAELAFVRHATSKIRVIDDLVTTRTMGFRGEALPSIASVSLTQLLTRMADAGAATLIRHEGGRLVTVEDAAGPPGTQVTVRNLFYNVPARLKFLRTEATETSAAVEAVGRAAVARPDIAFSVEVDGRISLRTDGRGDRLAVILELWGREVAGLLVPLDFSDGGLRVEGFIGRPEAHRGSRSRQLLLVNGRPVQSAALAKAFEEAYAGLLPSGRRPIGAVLLEVPGEAVDVNVHPAKAEVRLAREREAFSFLRAGVAAALRGGGMIREVAAGSAGPAVLAGWTAPGGTACSPVREDLRSTTMPPGRAAEGAALFGGGGTALPADPTAAAPAGAPWPELRPLGQLHRLYLLAEGPDGLYLIDQHAAHERIIYDRLARQSGRAGQPLLVPLSVELSAAEAETFARHREALADAGFQAEPFGPRSLLVRSVPGGTGEDYGPTDVREVLEALSGPTGGAGPETAQGREHVRRAIAACRGAVKARNPLFRSEMEALLRDLAATDNPLTCPHGRPTVIKLTLAELNRRFGRGGGTAAERG